MYHEQNTRICEYNINKHGIFNYINDGSMNTVINRRRKLYRLLDDYFVNSVNMKFVHRLNLEYDEGIGFVAEVKRKLRAFCHLDRFLLVLLLLLLLKASSITVAPVSYASN